MIAPEMSDSNDAFRASNPNANDSVYDDHVATYLEFIDRALATEPSLFRNMLGVFAALIGDRLRGARVLDFGCGEGYLSRFLAARGAAHVVGVDLSSRLIEVARQRTESDGVEFVVDDARVLRSIPDSSVDVVVSQMALMDIADHVAAFQAARRVLRADGVLVVSLLHPCFESPFRPPDEPHFLVDDSGVPVANVVRHYAAEGHWREEGAGLRGHVGSHHRMLSTYVNDLIGAGFRLTRIEEPLVEGGGLFAEVPRVMLLAAEPLP